MGAGPKMAYPKWVWSPAGGWCAPHTSPYRSPPRFGSPSQPLSSKLRPPPPNLPGGGEGTVCATRFPRRTRPLLARRYCNPPNWQRNTAIVAVGWMVAWYFTFNLSASLERRLCPPCRPIPSQSWCKHAKEDDPSCS